MDEANRKLDTRSADGTVSTMAVASYERRWKLAPEEPTVVPDEPETVEPDTSKPETEETHVEPMKMSEVVNKLESLFDILNKAYFENALPKPVITVQSTPKAYGHCTTKKIWHAETDAMYEINLGAEFLTALRPTLPLPCAMKWYISIAS